MPAFIANGSVAAIRRMFDIAEIAEDVAVLVAQKQAQIFGFHIDSASGVTLAFGRDIRAGHSGRRAGPEKRQEQPSVSLVQILLYMAFGQEGAGRIHLVKGAVNLEPQLWRVLHRATLHHQMPDLVAVFAQRKQRLDLLLATKWQHKRRRDPQVGRHAHLAHCDHKAGQFGIMDFTTLQDSRKVTADHLADLQHTLRGRAPVS